MTNTILENPNLFSQTLYEKMLLVNPGVMAMELDEFRYALEPMIPGDGWQSITLEPMQAVEEHINNLSFYISIQLKPYSEEKLVMDPQIKHLCQMLFVGLVKEDYPLSWINFHFYFDIRGFYFLHRTRYFTSEAIHHLGDRPFLCFETRPESLISMQSIGYKAFKDYTRDVNQCFVDMIHYLVEKEHTPCLIAIAGQTAAGKTEIVSRLTQEFNHKGKQITSIEMDHFLTDRDYREANGIDSMGKEALHYEILKRCLTQIINGEKIQTPRYDFIDARSSHDLQGNLKPGGKPIEIKPADIILIEGNVPFLLPDIAPLINIKVLYLTEDEIRLKRKWRRDMDYRKKYELMYFLNRYFREQYLMAEKAYIPQSILCDLLVNTTGGEIWVRPELQHRLSGEKYN